MAMASAANEVLVGFHFEPSDQELVGFFLHKLLVKKQPLKPPYNSFIHEYNNLFGNQLLPSEIWKTYGRGQDLYFFCPLKKLTPKRIDRKDGRGGTWSQKDVPQSVMADGNPNPIGRKRKFRYVNQGSEDHTDWLIDEYSLFSQNHCDDAGYDFDSGICRLRKNDRAGTKRKSTFSSAKNGANKKKKVEGGSSSTDSQITIMTDNTSDSSTLLGSPSFNVDDVISDVNKLAIPISEVGLDAFLSESHQLSTLISESCSDGGGEAWSPSINELPLSTSVLGADGRTEEEASNVTEPQIMNVADSSTLLGNNDSQKFNVDDVISDVNELAIPISEVGLDAFLSESHQLSTLISESCSDGGAEAWSPSINELPLSTSDLGADGRTEEEASNVTDSATLLGNNDSQKFNVDDFVTGMNEGAVEVWNSNNFDDVWNQPLDSSYNLLMDDLWA